MPLLDFKHHIKCNYNKKEQKPITVLLGDSCTIEVDFSDSLIGEELPRFNFLKPDGEIVKILGNTVDIEKGIAEISLTPELLNIAGEYQFDIRRTEGEKWLTSPTYIFTVLGRFKL